MGYHGEMIPFHILSFPIEFFLFQHNLFFSEIIAKNFVYFWTIPTSFYFMFFWFYTTAITIKYDKTRHHMQIKPQKISMPVNYLITTKHDPNFIWNSGCARTCFLILIFLELFLVGFLFTLPFAPLMMI